MKRLHFRGDKLAERNQGSGTIGIEEDVRSAARCAFGNAARTREHASEVFM